MTPNPPPSRAGDTRSGQALDDPAEHWNAFWRKRSRRLSGRMIAWVRKHIITPALARFVAGMTQRGVLIEAGCGSGEVSLDIARRRGDRLILVDVSPDALAMARDNAAARGIDATLLECDVARLSEQIGAVADGIVYNIGVVEHFAEPAGVLREMAAASGRYALAVIPERTFFWTSFVSLCAFLRLVPPDFCIRLYDPYRFRRALERAGLEILRVGRMRLLGVICYLGISFRSPSPSAEDSHGRP